MKHVSTLNLQYNLNKWVTEHSSYQSISRFFPIESAVVEFLKTYQTLTNTSSINVVID